MELRPSCRVGCAAGRASVSSLSGPLPNPYQDMTARPAALVVSQAGRHVGRRTATRGRRQKSRESDPPHRAILAPATPTATPLKESDQPVHPSIVKSPYADGINFRNGVRNSQVIQSTFRNTGDDGLAMWSDGNAVQDSVLAFNTVQAPALSNGLAVYGGGGGNRIEDNLVSDTVEAAAGIAVSTRFGVPFTGTTTVQRNTLTRTGSMETNWNSQLGGLWIYADVHDINAPIVIRDNTIADSTFAGVLMSWQKPIQQVSFQNVSITGSGTYGIEIHASGSATFTGTSVTGSGTAGLLNDGGFTVTRVSGNSGF